MIQLRPSAAHIWTKCSANPALSARVPREEPSDPAREGTCAAWLAEIMLKGETDLIGRVHENGWVVDPSMVNYVSGYVKLLRSYNGQVDVERKVRLNPMIEGTPDAFAVLADATLNVDDLKYGFGIVDVWENPQVMIYAGALLRHMTAHGTRIVKVRLGIYQPRAFHVGGTHRTWTLFPEELMNLVREIETRGVCAQDPNALATPGEHCRYCPAAAICGAVAKDTYRAVSRMQISEARNMTAEEMSAELDFLERAETMFKGRRDAVHTEAMARITRGENIPNWSRFSAIGQRRFKYPREMVKMITGVDPVEEKLITPAELERRGVLPEVVSALSEKPMMKASLQRVTSQMIASKFGVKS